MQNMLLHKIYTYCGIRVKHQVTVNTTWEKVVGQNTINKQHEHSIFVVDVFCYSFTKGATNLVVDVYGDGEVADTAWLCK